MTFGTLVLCRTCNMCPLFVKRAKKMYIPVFPLILDASVPAVSPAGDIAVVVYGWHVDDVVGDGRGSSKKLQYNNASFK